MGRVAPEQAEIELYTWTTPNGRKASIMLEELGVPYAVHAVDITADQQFVPDFLKVSPNNKIPAIVDRRNGFTLMGSGAILLYLAHSYGALLPEAAERQWRAKEWLMWQMGGFGPMLGQAHHFLKYNPGRSEYAEQRYASEAQRLYGVLERRLEGRDFVADEYSVADIAIWPWVSRYEWQGIDLDAFPNVGRWYRRLDQLKRNHRQLQLEAYLDRFELATAKIESVGAGRKQTLESYGIETALDVTQAALFSVPGFGPKTNQKLLRWRAGIEAKFVFNPSLPVDPREIQKVEASVLRDRSELEGKLRQGLLELRQIAAQVLSVRQHMRDQVAKAFDTKLQADADLAAIGR